MARRGGVGDLAYAATVGILGLVAYQLGSQGQLGVPVKNAIDTIKGSLVPTGDGRDRARRGMPAATRGPSGGTNGGGTGSLSAMQAANPNVGRQMLEWQNLRKQRGENHLDWEAFRAHERAMGNYDPGPASPPEFVGYGVY